MPKQRPSVKRLRKRRIAKGKRIQIPGARRIYPQLIDNPTRVELPLIVGPILLIRQEYSCIIGTMRLKRLLNCWEWYYIRKRCQVSSLFQTHSMSNVLNSWKDMNEI